MGTGTGSRPWVQVRVWVRSGYGYYKSDSDVISDVKLKARKSPKMAKIMVFAYFFKQKLRFLAMKCVKACLRMLLLQINQINR